ncbi:conserved hypothetical protein [Saccharophagus degradans 2-40]|uniref:Uncharacterized protein n=2 Tax=Saccharophagus degradans TaxID=86304 RepID=Q21KS7_SACD2|nr:conserved hypothetical protein [Saccharophagus degradans 2-40]
MIGLLRIRAIRLILMAYVAWALPAKASATEQISPATKIVITRYCGQSITPGNAHIEKLIYLAFSKLNIQPTFNNVNQYCSHSREVKFLQEGKSDILWATTTADYEQQLIPIRIPIYKGLLGYRIALIRAEDKGKFAHITTLEQLQTLRFGQGEGWADTAILKEAGLKVTESSDVHNLFNMLRAGRFDLFPRGLMEPWEEVKQLPTMNFAVEEHILIVYPLPAYIFVSPKRPELAKLILTGLELAIQDGSFDKLVMADPNVQQALRLANIKQRKIFYLENSTLTKETPLSNKALWVNLK